MKIAARIFRFDAKMDYLGSYIPFTYKASADATLLDLLRAFQAGDPLCQTRLDLINGVRANGVGAGLNAPLSNFGGEITIEPLMIDRAVLDLECDGAVFENRLNILGEFCDKDDADYYRSFQMAFAVSPARSLNREYLGEALFMLAARLISKEPRNAREILSRVSAPRNGVFYYAGLNGVLDKSSGIDESLVSNTIFLLQESAAAFAPKGFKPAKFAAAAIADLPIAEKKAAAICADVGTFSAVKNMEDYERALLGKGAARVIRLKNRVSGVSFAFDRDFSLKAAADLLLEASDAGAETLVCLCAETREFLQKNIKPIERVCSHPIGLEIA